MTVVELKARMIAAISHEEHYIFVSDHYLLWGWRINNGWFVDYAAAPKGDPILAFLKFIPYELEYIGWRRPSRLDVKWYRTSELIEKLESYGRRRQQPGTTPGTVGTPDA